MVDAIGSYKPNLSSEYRADNRNPYDSQHKTFADSAGEWISDTAGIIKEHAVTVGSDVKEKAADAGGALSDAAGSAAHDPAGTARETVAELRDASRDTPAGKTAEDSVELLKSACMEAQLAAADEYAYEDILEGA